MAWSIFTDGGGDNVAVAWAQQFLTKIGAPVTPGNTEFVYQWEKSEGGGGKYNPLNTGGVYGHPELTTTGTQYGGGANDFASWDAGLTGSAINTETPGPDNYPAIITALKNNNPSEARQALWSSGWAASHYGYGANWSNASLPGNSGNVVPPSFFSGSAATASSAKAPDCTLFTGHLRDACIAANKSAGFDQNGNPIPGASQGSSGSSGSVFSIGGFSILNKTQARAVIGAAILLAGGTLMTLGILALMKSAAVQTNAVSTVQQLPVIGRAAKRFT